MTASFAFVGSKRQPKPLAALSRFWALLVLLGVAAPAHASHSVALQGATIALQSAPSIAPALIGTTIPLQQGDQLLFLSVDLKPGWKTYWRLPGRFGLPPAFTWELDGGDAPDVRVHFPRPQLFSEGDGRSVGYTEPVLWPVVVSGQARGSQQGDDQALGILTLTLSLGLCEILCLPETATLQVDLQSLGSLPSPSMSDVLALSSALPTAPQPVPDVWQAWLQSENASAPVEGHFLVLESALHHHIVSPDSTSNWPFPEEVQRMTLVPRQGAPLVYTTDLQVHTP